MKELIERLEAASEGSRELDLAIATAGGNDLASSDAPTFAYHGGSPVCEWSTGSTPHYTTSLDAALKLVPEGYDEELKRARHRRGWHVVLWRPERFGQIADAPTPALALCIAAIKSREASK